MLDMAGRIADQMGNGPAAGGGGPNMGGAWTGGRGSMASVPTPMAPNTRPLWGAMERYDRGNSPSATNRSIFRDAYQLYHQGQAPTLQGYANQFALQQNQLGQIGADQATQAGFLRQNYGLDSRLLDVQQNGVQRNLGFSRQEEAIARQMLGNSQAQANQTATEAAQRARNEAIAGGAYAAPGITTDLTNIYANLVHDREANQLGFNRDQLSIRQQRGMLRDQARTLGINEDQLRVSLDQGLANLRISGFADTNALLQAMNSTNTARRQLAMDVYQQALTAAQSNPLWR